MGRYTPTTETVAFAKEAFRVKALIRHGVANETDLSRLGQMGAVAQCAQQDANRRVDEAGE